MVGRFCVCPNPKGMQLNYMAQSIAIHMIYTLYRLPVFVKNV